MNKIIQGECVGIMKTFLENSIDLTVTSPPYDDLRNYKGYSFDFENIARELYRITKQGGVVVWIVGDAVINKSESGTTTKMAKLLGRNYIGIDISEEYCNIARERLGQDILI